MELGFPHRTEPYRAKGSSRSSLGCWSCRDLEGLLIRRWDCILPGCGGNMKLARLVTLAARWLHELQSTSNLPVGLGSPHLTAQYRPVESSVSSSGDRRFSNMETKQIRRWDLILPECGENAVLARGAPLAARPLLHPHLTSNLPVVAGFPPRGSISTRVITIIAPRVLELYRYRWIQIRGWDLINLVSGADSALAQGATLPARYLHESQPTSYYQSAIAVRVSHRAGRIIPRGAVSIQRISVCVSGLLELSRCGKASDPDMGLYLPRVRWKRDVRPLGNYCRSMAP